MVATSRREAPAKDGEAPRHRHVTLRTRLDLVTEIGAAVAAGDELAAIIELAGRRVATLLDNRSVAIALYDQSSGLISFPFEEAEGRAPTIRTTPFQLGPGLTSEVIRSGRPLLLSTSDETVAHGAIVVGELDTESWLGVPMLAGGSVRGAIILESPRRRAFDDSDVNLLSTLAASIGVAVDQARLVDETKRLLGESEARTAELSLINEIGTALAKQLDFDAIIELVGDRLRALFDTRSLSIALIDEAAGRCSWAYEVEEGEHVHNPPFEIGIGLTSKVIAGRRPIMAGTNTELYAMGAHDLGGAPTESWLGVPILAGERVIAVIILESIRQQAFTEADARLLTTLGTSMGV
ncbi:MAG TPA: GAF domain-containing protein, partial [Candidatus Sulfotelmatobacter sp.]|nr:GAF domain-containing protein [Candidatus Sulfotelmatobacter sp.]